MGTSVFPSSTALPGIDIKITRTTQWSTIVQEAVSGKETRVARRQFPRRVYALQFNFLRTASAYLEFQALEAFFNNRQGMYDSFLWSDPDDYTVTGQSLGQGDGVTTQFALIRVEGNGSGNLFAEPTYAPNHVATVYLGGVALTSTQWSVSLWGTTVSQGPGVITFSSAAPSAGQNITADFTYYWPVRFTNDDMNFEKLVNLIWEAKKVTFTSII
jgi:uncharacterized protein (TIGR02217 family)